MNHFNIKTENGQNFITLETADFKMLISKDRELSENDYGYLYEGTAYVEVTKDREHEYFVFEVVSLTETDDIERSKKLTNEAMKFFFHSVIGVEYFTVSVPEFSEFYDADLYLPENDSNEIDDKQLPF
ncbi:hypothetical protein [Mucilaginibacter aquaedulcis]|uniref:hypothetical protein n=1 Tax=Mucilaginibacter aquaedulcis TaxID=1187081 RepID=UPI0025B4D792|nr:hypothetical protein [Mucilaginibacter aquaedulcis]MDN3550186.1 hypothetical protein [Mucilaginibacter aquaedulcis]